MYEVKYDKNALDELDKLPVQIKNRIVLKLRTCQENPFSYFYRLQGMQEYSLRVGDYRVIAEIKENKLLILIVYVEHRKKVYKKRE